MRVERSGGGFLIVWSEFPDLIGGERAFDHWVEGSGALDNYFSAEEIDWDIPEPTYEAPRPGDTPER